MYNFTLICDVCLCSVQCFLILQLHSKKCVKDARVNLLCVVWTELILTLPPSLLPTLILLVQPDTHQYMLSYYLPDLCEFTNTLQ